jgi:hypothetical protein
MFLSFPWLYSLSWGGNLQGKVIGLPLRENREVLIAPNDISAGQALIYRRLSLPTERTRLPAEGTYSLILALAFSEFEPLS